MCISYASNTFHFSILYEAISYSNDPSPPPRSWPRAAMGVLCLPKDRNAPINVHSALEWIFKFNRQLIRLKVNKPDHWAGKQALETNAGVLFGTWRTFVLARLFRMQRKRKWMEWYTWLSDAQIPNAISADEIICLLIGVGIYAKKRRNCAEHSSGQARLSSTWESRSSAKVYFILAFICRYSSYRAFEDSELFYTSGFQPF